MIVVTDPDHIKSADRGHGSRSHRKCRSHRKKFYDVVKKIIMSGKFMKCLFGFLITDCGMSPAFLTQLCMKQTLHHGFLLRS